MARKNGTAPVMEAPAVTELPPDQTVFKPFAEWEKDGLHVDPLQAACRSAAEYRHVPVGQVWIWEGNPRRDIDEESLAELAESIREHGLIQPITVRPLAGRDGVYSVVAGERRLHACILAGLTTVPCIVRDMDDRAALEVAIIENLQRQDINAMEQARAYQRLVEMGYKQREIADRVKRSQPSVANAIRLTELPDEVQDLIAAGALSPSHGLALLSLKDWPEVLTARARHAVAKRQTVKDLECPLALDYGAYTDLQDQGLIKVLPKSGAYGYFRPAECDNCPFGALIAAGEGYYQNEICLRPSHYEELETAHKAELATERAAVVEKIKTERPELAGAEIPTLQSMSHDSYQTIWNESHVPAGCSPECECRAQALRGDEVIPICTNPGRYRKLEAAANRAKNKERREKVAQLWADAKQLLRDHRDEADVTSKMSVVLGGSWWQLPGDEVISELGLKIPQIRPNLAIGQAAKTWDALAKVPFPELLAYLVHEKLENLVRESEGEAGGSSMQRLEWFVGSEEKTSSQE